MKLTSMAHISEKKLKKVPKHKIKTFTKNKSVQFNGYNQFYTTLNNSIKYIADIVYQEIGEGINNNQMSFSNFNTWISRNKGILQTFDKWLRKDIWGNLNATNSTINNNYSKIEGYALINMKKKRKKLKFYKKVFVELRSNILIISEDSTCLLYTSPSPRDLSTSRMPSSA